MTLTAHLFAADMVTDLQSNLNALLAVSLTQRLLGFELDQTGLMGQSRVQGFYSLTLDTDGASVITSPYVFHIVSGQNAETCRSILQTFIDANPTYWFSPAFTLFTPASGGAESVRYGIFYNTDATDGVANWGPAAVSAGGPPTGPAGGDLGGNYPNPDVLGLNGLLLGGTPAAGRMLVVNDAGTGLTWYVVQVYASLAAAAAAQANQVINQNIIISNTPAGSADGTYQLNAKTASPADYTKLSDATDTASEVATVDAGNFFTGSDVESNLQQLGKYIKQVALVSGASVATNAALGSVFTLALATNATLANPTNLTAGQTVVWIVTQTAGGNTLAYDTLFSWPGGTAPTLSTGAGDVDVITGVYDGVKIRAVAQLDFV